MEHRLCRRRRLERRSHERAASTVPNQQTPLGQDVHRPVGHDRRNAQHPPRLGRRQVMVTGTQRTPLDVHAQRIRKLVDSRSRFVFFVISFTHTGYSIKRQTVMQESVIIWRSILAVFIKADRDPADGCSSPLRGGSCIIRKILCGNRLRVSQSFLPLP